MSVFVWPTLSRALAKLNQRGIDKDCGPTGHSGCAEESGLALATGTETYILRHSGVRSHTEAYTNTLGTCRERDREREAETESQTYIASTRGVSESKHPSKCLTQLTPS